MKKFLLFAAAALVTGTSFADGVTTDPDTYDEVDGYVLTNRWLKASSNLGVTEYSQMPWMNSPNYCRTVTVADYNGKKIIILANSKDVVDKDKGPVDQGTFYYVDLLNGELVKKVTPTLDGKPFETLLCVNQIGTDDFGHIWFAGYCSNTYVQADADKGTEARFQTIKFYKVDNLETGECSQFAEVGISDGDEIYGGRTDYYDIVGDVTREEARCVIMSAPSSNGTVSPFVYGWVAEQGEDEFMGLFDEYVVSDYVGKTHPLEQGQWGTGAYLRIIKDEDFTADLFYTDGNATTPNYYDKKMALQDGIANTEAALWPETGCNGAAEITLNGDNFFLYPIKQYASGGLCESRIIKLGESMNFDAAKECWVFPKAGLGSTSDGGNRIHCLQAVPVVDANNVEGAYIVNYKCANGLGVYTMAPKDFIDPNGDAGVDNIIADTDVNAPVEYFNLNGVQVSGDNLTPGLYITRQGNTVAKRIIK